MRNVNTTLLLMIAIADAYAMATEFVDASRDCDLIREALAFRRYVKHPKYQQFAGQYTDDTEMSCANARVLIAHPPPYEPIEFARAWLDEFNRGGRRKGYAKKFQSFLESVADGEEFLAKINSASDSNGACMRAVPIGVLPKIEDVISVATLQAKITHDTPPALFSARAVALMTHYALHVSDTFEGLQRFLRINLPPEDAIYLDELRTPWVGRVHKNNGRPLAVSTVHAAYFVIRTNSELIHMLEDIIQFGGDTDSVAAITWGIASTLHREEELPDFLFRELEGGNPRTGTFYLRDLGSRLMRAYA
ncbi:MAG: ADP-ribosylglycohydrolase family protein [Patescibacteria group bacterium]|nr:ADP-ribosylglycohydrolase family protein [Patescibacteria group bacterium]